MRKLFCFIFLASLSLFCWKLAPVMQEKETYNQWLSVGSLKAKLQEAIPKWVSEQISDDFKETTAITSESVESTYKEICARIGPTRICHYRILDNKLYKFHGKRSEYKSRDSRFEIALKTLLSHCKIPDTDFLYCPMDGVPEPYLPSDSFLSSNQSPIFAQAKIDHSRFIVLIPDQFSLSNEWADTAKQILALNQEITWQQKKESAVWRGGLTDLGQPHEIPLTESVDFNRSPRYLLSKLSNLSPTTIDAGINWMWKEADNLVPILEKEHVLKDSLSKRGHLLHKYLPVLDGHMCTYPGYQWRLLSNSVALKQESDQIQWFYAALEPYIHFIPIQNGMEDLPEKIEWAKKNDAEVQKIIANAQAFTKDHLMFEDNYAYLFRALKQYASLQKIDFDQMKASTQNDPKWLCIQYRKKLKCQRNIQRAFFSFSKSFVEEK